MRTVIRAAVVVAIGASISGCHGSDSNAKKHVATERSAKLTLWPVRCYAAGICLVYTGAVNDRDRDLISDEDEKALGTDPESAASTPSLEAVIDAIARRALPSFARDRSGVAILPKEGPGGHSLAPPDLGSVRASSAERLGIADATLAQFGLSLDGGVVLQKIPGVGERDTSRPHTRVGGIDLGLISEDKGESGDGAPVHPNDEGGGVLGGDSQGGKTFFGNVKEELGKWKDEAVQGVKDKANSIVDAVKGVFSPAKTPSGGSSDGGTKLTSGDDEVGIAVPLTKSDYDRVAAKLNANRTPGPEHSSGVLNVKDVDLNPRRTIVLVTGDDNAQDPRFERALKIFPVNISITNGADRNTNYGPNGGLVPNVVEGSGWPKR